MNLPMPDEKILNPLRRGLVIPAHPLALNARRQMDENPLRNVKKPKSPEQEVHTFTDDECARLIRAAREWKVGAPVPWDLLIIVSLATAMRRGELLNTTWSDIDFGAKTIKVTPKKDTDETWE